MLSKRLLSISLLSSILAGCAGFSGSQPPAPVYQSRQPVYRDKPAHAARSKAMETAPAPTEIVETKPLAEPGIAEPVELEPLPAETEEPLLTPEQEQELAALEQQAQQTPPDGATVATPAPTDSLPEPAPPPPPPKPAFTPLTDFAPLSPALNALVLAANKNSAQGDMRTAAMNIERAIRIEPRNATLYYKLALLRLKEAKPRLAEDLAKKCISLAGSDTRLKKHSWLLIARVREIQNNSDGVTEAKAKADALSE